MKEALVVCGSKNLTVGVTIWDIETGDHLLHIPTCASPFHGITCLRDQYLVASQIHHPGSVAGGVIFTWPFSKPRACLRSYTVEAIEHLSSTKDGVYLAGGATSGNVYLWEPRACLRNYTVEAIEHLSSTKDGVYLAGGATSGNVYLWEVWDLVQGTLLQTLSFPQPITAAVLDPAERFLFSGSADGRIFMSPFDVGLMKESCVDSKDVKIELSGHKESITALTFSRSGLISASEDCTACLWDVVEGVIIRRFYHHRGFITNMAVIPKSSLVPLTAHQRKTTHFPVSLLQKYSQQTDPSKDTVTLISSSSDQQITHQFQSDSLLNQQIHDLEVGRTPEALQLKVGTNIKNRLWIIDMTKRVMEMNNHLQSRLFDLKQHRISLEETEAKRNKNI
ncbi:G-protein beta WD-40 repeat-containing protein [Artemisia annua]|uniref:G-protein beta WD-40 repeat-containing protein n=1 Tax=Artemisia annua TaxID=35608 RepID=A0A2U1MBR4_ARTAN|nr:G-protein beta WD-40 repeat-containing protein [Artemisia annua]